MGWTGATTARRKLVYLCGEFNLTEDGASRKPEVIMRSEDVTVGCTIVSRTAIEKLHSLFQEKFPKLASEVKIQ
jgi:hypothetical protein